MLEEIIKKKTERFAKTFLWGSTHFASGKYLKFGYFEAEDNYVKKYLTTPSDVLVIGSSNGREAFPIAQDGHNIVCMDNAGFYVYVGQRQFARMGNKNVIFVQADMHGLPFEHESFDFVFFSLYFFTGDRRAQVLDDIYRILRPGGHILFSCGTELYVQMNTYLTPGNEISDQVRLVERLAECRNEFELVDYGIDSKRPEYLFAVLRKPVLLK